MCQRCVQAFETLLGAQSDAASDPRPKIPEGIRSGSEIAAFYINGRQTAVMQCVSDGGKLNMHFLAGNPDDKLAVEINNISSIPVLAVVAFNGISVFTGNPATRDGDAVLVLPRTKCKIQSWYDGSPLTLFGAPVGYDRNNIAMGTLGVYTYEIVDKPDPEGISLVQMASRGFGAALREMMNQPTVSQTRSGAWKDLRTGSPVPAALLPRKYPAGQQIEIRYDTADKLAERNIVIPSADKVDNIDAWWTNSVFPGDDRAYTGGRPTMPRDERSTTAARPSWEREAVRV